MRALSVKRRMVTKLGSFWKYRVGDWRIVISIGDAVLTVVVIEIDHRSTVYRWRRLFCRPFRSLADF